MRPFSLSTMILEHHPSIRSIFILSFLQLLASGHHLPSIYPNHHVRMNPPSLSSSSSSTESPPPMNPASSGKCPVDHKAASGGSLWSIFGSGRSASSKIGSKDTQDVQKIDQNSRPMTNLPASLEEAAKHAQSPHPTQRLPLSTHRAESTIPRGPMMGGQSTCPQSQQSQSSSEISKISTIPHHQLGVETDKWVYPSEQQVFNAMKRKGWEHIEEESIPSFLQIHNSVNERSWKLLQEWENIDNHQQLRLVRFEGRPNELTPKAWIWSKLFFQDPPFDRHDWYVDNGVDKEKRYVLDFYMKDTDGNGMRSSSTILPRVEIDVRPALDTPSAVYERAQRLLMDIFPGITTELQRMKNVTSASSNNQQQQQQQQSPEH